MRSRLILTLLLLLANASFASNTWDSYSDTWVATDALGRKLPTTEVGAPRPDRFVGIFYFLWHGQHGQSGPFNTREILAANPDNPQWGPLHLFHYWDEPELGYYLPTDEFVIRNHARMLTDAGVDVLLLDVTNAFTYTDVYMNLLKVFDKINAEGSPTPKIAFLLNSAHDLIAQKLYDEFYSKGLYKQHWFMWKGKPLMLASPDKLTDQLKSFFTLRQSWAWTDPKGWFGDGYEKWPWLDYYPQKPGWIEKGKAEQLSVSVAQHPTSNVGRSYHQGKQPPKEQWQTDRGLFFEEQWSRILGLGPTVDPEFVLITGWNEWVAQRFESTGSDWLTGRKLPKGETYFVDSYTEEFSRDIEPLKGGYGDNYYYQMMAAIRKYKGARQLPMASLPKHIKVDGDHSEWRAITPEFRDTIGDNNHRDHKGWGDKLHYKDDSGRYDIRTAKVSWDRDNVYFQVTWNPGRAVSNNHFMLVFLDIDQKAATGFGGYELMVQPLTRRIFFFDKKSQSWKPAGACIASAGNGMMEMSMPRNLFRRQGVPKFDFHIADNPSSVTDYQIFITTGDHAPNRRANFRYTGRQ